MNTHRRSISFLILSLLCIYSFGQQEARKGLFDSDDLLQITLSGDLNTLFKDRADVPKLHPIVLRYQGMDSTVVSIQTLAKTRGHFRKLSENCDYPPILLDFTNKGNTKSTLFSEQDKLKLVMPCQGDEYVVREYLVYKIYNLITPMGFRARLVKITLDNKQVKKTVAPFYGFLLEEESQMAKRNNLLSLNKPRRPENTEYAAFLTMATFEYMIGNTDWSVQYLQNIKLLAKDSNSIPTTVPYDFDHAGIVDATYAKPAEELQISSTRQRMYRGYCVKDMKQFDPAIATFNSIKKDIYSLYQNNLLLSEKYKKSTIKFLDEFYATINNLKNFEKDFSYPCDPNGTGNIIIKGLK